MLQPSPGESLKYWFTTYININWAMDSTVQSSFFAIPRVLPSTAWSKVAHHLVPVQTANSGEAEGEMGGMSLSS